MSFKQILTACAAVLCGLVSAFSQAPVQGQWEVRERTATGMLSRGVTLNNGQVLGKVDGLPAAVTPFNGTFSALSGKPTTILGYGITNALVTTNNLSDLTDAAVARSNLGLVIGTNVQAYNASLAAIAGGTWTGSSSITTLGTITTGVWNGTTIPVARGGTGATSLAANNVLLGNGTSALQAVAPGVAGSVLTSDGTTWTSAAPASAGYMVKSSNYTAVAGDRISADVSGGPFTITLPANPEDADSVEIMPARGTFATNNLTVARNGENINGTAADVILSSSWGAVFVYRTGYGWRFYVGGLTQTSSYVTLGSVRFDPSYGTISDGQFSMNAFGSTPWLCTDGANNAGISSPSYNSGVLNFICGAGLKSRITSEGTLEFLQVASGGTPAENSARIYAKDVGGVATIHVMDESGTEGRVIAGTAGNTDNAVLRADGTDGAKIQASPVVIDDVGNIKIPIGKMLNLTSTETYGIYWGAGNHIEENTYLGQSWYDGGEGSNWMEMRATHDGSRHYSTWLKGLLAVKTDAAALGAFTVQADTAGIRAKGDPAQLYAWDEAGNETRLTLRGGGCTAMATVVKVAYDPASIAAGTTETTTATLTGCVAGSSYLASPQVHEGLIISASRTAADTVTITFYNPTGGAIDAAAVDVRVVEIGF